MRLTERTKNVATGTGLIALVLATRLPFLSHTLFEFDSVDFAVAMHRFSLQEVTPHMPGYIIHLLLGKLFLNFTSSDNSALLAISVLLSIGAVLFLWRAAYALRGERVALIAALIWVSNPIFWLYGEVATAYIHEAFFASALLYFGITRLRAPREHWRALAVAVLFSLAIGARQSSFLFFLPALIYLFYKVRLPLKHLFFSVVLFSIVSSAWLAILFHYSGGAQTYFHYAALEHIYRTQSVIFGNPAAGHLAVISKVVVYLFVGSFSLLLLLLFCVLRFRRWLLQFVRECGRTSVFAFTTLVAFPALLFYFAIYFMKAGYLLNVLPSIVLIGAVLVDSCAIWLARTTKERAGNAGLLTRPLITRNVIVLTSLLLLINTLWVLAPLPGKSEDTFRDELSRESFSANLASRYPDAAAKEKAILNKLFAYSSVQSARATDALNDSLTAMLTRERSSGEPLILLSTWWSRMAYYQKRWDDFDIQTIAGKRMEIGESREWIRKPIQDSVIRFPHHSKIVLLIRSDHPDLVALAQQVHLIRRDAPRYLDLYEIADSTFTFRWDGVTFKRD